MNSEFGSAIAHLPGRSTYEHYAADLIKLQPFYRDCVTSQTGVNAQKPRAFRRVLCDERSTDLGAVVSVSEERWIDQRIRELLG